MTGRLSTVIALVFLTLAATLPGVFQLPALDRDEARFAQATVQMLETGDYVEIRFQDTARNKKPVGIHWLQAAAVSASSNADARAIWAYRLPSIAAAVITVLCAYAAGCVLLGQKAASAGAALLAVSLMFGIESGIAKTDSMLTAMTALSFVGLAKLYEGGGRGWAVLVWFGLGASVLIKGPVGPMIVMLAIVTLIIVDRRAGWLKPLAWWPGPLLLIAMVAPWIYLIQQATDGAFLAAAFGKDLGPKLVSGHESHGGVFGQHLLLMPILIWPATLFVLPGVAYALGAFMREFHDHEAGALRFLAAWAFPAWLVFEIVPTKLWHYPLPLYPALALMAGAAYAAFADKRLSLMAWKPLGALTLAAVGGLIVLVLFALPNLAADGGQALDDLEAVAALDAITGLPPVQLAMAAVFAAVLFIAPLAFWVRPSLTIVTACLAGLAVQWGALGVVAPKLDAFFVSDRVSDELVRLTLHPRLSANAKPPLIAVGYHEPSLVFATRTDTALVGPEEGAALLGVESGRAAIVEERERAAFEAALDALGAEAVAMGQIEGFNYSKGRYVELTIYRTVRPSPVAAGGAR